MTERPSVLHFTTTGAIAGTEQAVMDLSAVHDRLRWNVAFGTLFPCGPMNVGIEKNGARCNAMNVRSSTDVPLAVIKLASLLRSQNIQVLHTHLLHAGLVGVLAARLAGRKSIRLVHTRHHSDELHRFGPPIKAKIDRYVALSQDLVCANSLASRDVLIDLEGVNPDRIRLTYPGVNLASLRQRVTDPTGDLMRAELGFSKENPIIGSVAHLLPKKGHKFLLQAMVSVLESIPRAKLVIAGRGPEQEHLTKLAKTLGISDAVKLLGFRDDIPNVVNVFDIVAQPSIEEAFGLSMVEAMALGKPIVGSNVGGIPEVVDDGVTGILVPPGDCNALSKAIVDLLNDPARRNQFGDAGKLRAETLFTIERLACDYEGAWTEVLSKNHESYNVR